MNFSKEHALTITLSIVLLILFVVAVNAGWSVYQSLQTGSEDTATDTLAQSELYEGVSRDVAETIETARDTFARERDYAAAIAQLEALAQNPNLTADERGRLLLTQASQSLRNDTLTGIQLFTSIYKDETYSNRIRAEALESVNWHYSSDVLNFSSFEEVASRATGGLTSRELFAFVYGPDGLGFITEEEAQTMTLNEARQIFINVYNTAIDLQSDRYLSYSLAATQYAKLLTYPGRSQEEIDISLNRIQSLLNVAETGIAQYEEFSLANNRYDSGTAFSKLFNARAMYYLYFAGLADISLLEEKAEAVFAYTSNFFDQSYTSKVAASGAAELLVIALAHSENNQVTAETADQIRGLLENYYYILEDEDYERKSYNRSLSHEELLDPLRLEKRDSLRYVATEVDPRYQTIMLEKIGGWTSADFE